ncbi:MAG: Arm DNA-binding domain-containing protein [Alteromonadaceae bacterium]|nr:Arm DNA-binding domain-containing protein [Alteromonadaceae bacterium]
MDIGKDAQGKRKQKTKGGFKTKKAAEEACTELIELNKGEYVVPSKSTLGEYLQKWINSSAKQTMRDTWIPIRL